MRLADSDDVAGTGGGRRQHLRVVAYVARRFGAAAVDSEIVGHEKVLTQEGEDYRDSLAPDRDYLHNRTEIASIIGSPGRTEVQELLTAKVAKKGR